MNKITFVISSLAGGGAENVCVTVANGLVRIGWHVDLVVLTLKNSVYDINLDRRVTLHNLNVDKSRYAFFKILKHLLRYKPNNILVFDYQNTVLLVVIRKLLKLKYRLFARNINTITIERDHLDGFWNKQIVNRLIFNYFGDVDYVINQSQEMMEDLLTIYPALLKKTSVINNPIRKSISDFVNKNSQFEITKKKYILAVGRLERQKGFDDAIRVFNELQKDYLDLEFIIVGKGSLKSKLQHLIDELGLSDKVKMIGFQIDMIPFYLHSKVTILTSHFEGFPNVLLESIALGTPVVAFNCKSGPSDIIVHGVNGYLINDRNITEMSNHIKKLIDQPLNRELIIETSSKYLEQEIIIEYENLLLKLMDKNLTT